MKQTEREALKSQGPGSETHRRSNCFSTWALPVIDKVDCELCTTGRQIFERNDFHKLRARAAISIDRFSTSTSNGNQPLVSQEFHKSAAVARKEFPLLRKTRQYTTVYTLLPSSKAIMPGLNKYS